MIRKIPVLSFLLVILIACSTEKKFDFPLNEMESIKMTRYDGETFYSLIKLTPEYYYSNSSGEIQEVTAAFMYKNLKASIKIAVDYTSDKIKFIRLGNESDYFVFAIADLYEEPTQNTIMKENLECTFYDGEPDDISLLNKKQMYKVGYSPNPETEKGSVQISLLIDLIKGEISLGEKNSGIAKKNFVDAFRK